MHSKPKRFPPHLNLNPFSPGISFKKSQLLFNDLNNALIIRLTSPIVLSRSAGAAAAAADSLAGTAGFRVSIPDSTSPMAERPSEMVI